MIKDEDDICPECDVVSSCDEQWRTDSRFSQPDRKWVEIECDTVSVDDLKEMLGRAVANEEYEVASTLRDRIKELESK